MVDPYEEVRPTLYEWIVPYFGPMRYHDRVKPIADSSESKVLRAEANAYAYRFAIFQGVEVVLPLLGLIKLIVEK